MRNAPNALSSAFWLVYIAGQASCHHGSRPLPRVHLIFSLLERWILGTHQGSVSLKHLDGDLEEFTFRFDRRRARRITHGTSGPSASHDNPALSSRKSSAALVPKEKPDSPS